MASDIHLDLGDEDGSTADHLASDVAPSSPMTPKDQSEVFPGVTAHDVAFRFAPIWYQDTANNGPDGLGAKGDVPILVDYDGDLKHRNNWDNLPDYDAFPWLYYSVVATSTHYFLSYAHYQPRDWEQLCTGLFTECHEGDMGSAYVIVRRSGDGYGQVEAVRTHAHGENSYWWVGGTPSVEEGKASMLGPVDFEDNTGSISDVADGQYTHVRLFGQARGHGVVPCTASKKSMQPFGVGNVACPDGEGTEFPGEDGLKYIPTTDEPELFTEGQQNVETPRAYALVSTAHTLWVWRSDIGEDEMFSVEGIFQYQGSRGAPFFTKDELGYQFAADQFINDSVSGKPPWSEETEGASRGDSLLDPAYAFDQALGFPEPFSLEYTYHPFLQVTEPL